jgi:hypothetical protein
VIRRVRLALRRDADKFHVLGVALFGITAYQALSMPTSSELPVDKPRELTHDLAKVTASPDAVDAEFVTALVRRFCVIIH